jgi:tRNA(Arg) A34 adenosine deaminase TadA
MANGSKKIAWIKTDETTYSVSIPIDSSRSAIVELIERIYHAESLRPVSRARTILRERIFSAGEPTMVERETVKVAAKRISVAEAADIVSIELPETPSLPSFKIEGLVRGKVLAPSEISVELERLKRQTSHANEKWTSDRAVAAILVDENGQVIETAWNTNAVIRTRHAEANLCTVLREAGQSIPAGSTLYVSLKPCRMCAAKIWDQAEDPARLKIVYFENDPGRLAQGTILDSDSPARLRYLGKAHPLLSAKISALRSGV